MRSPPSESARTAFGLRVSSPLGLPGIPPAGGELVISLAPSRDLPADAPHPGWCGTVEGAPFVHRRGRAGDHLFEHGDRARFHLAADRRTLRCAPRDPADPGWRRVLLDSVLLTAALLAGREALHAGAVAIDGRAVAIAAPRGGGKTTVVAELLRRGRALVADDVVVVEPGARGVLALPAPPVLNVPAAARCREVGTVLDAFGDERWVLAGASVARAVPLAALAVLERAPGRVLALSERPPAVGELVALMLGIDDGPQRRRSRLDLLSALAASVRFARLQAPPDAPPARLADAVEGLLR